ncbi:MAG TPA: hypothetical protein VFT02_12345 [Pyrinomonadaceae bacterium]|nr:hypothetical protein [Pyrinomonadaceae bacterium]
MANHINRSDVEVHFKDIFGNMIADKVDIKIYNTQLQSLKNAFNVTFKGDQGGPATLEDIPAFPTGHAQLIVTPNKYRFKQRFINVQAGETNKITEYFFVDPSKANPHPIEFADLAAKSYGEELLRILKNSKIGAAAWNDLNKRNRATILNLCAKMSRETVKNGAKLITFVESIDQTWLDKKHFERIYAKVKKELLSALRNHSQVYSSVNGGMHHFPDGWSSVKEPDSFKTLRDSAGNIQLTFAEKSEQDGYLADIDLDDHKGLAHIADVLKHKFSGKNTDPYDIHQTLWFAQQLDPEYRLL